MADQQHLDLLRQGQDTWNAWRKQHPEIQPDLSNTNLSDANLIIKTGDKIRQRIDESIRQYDKLLLVLSQHSITSSWVEFEVEAALTKEDEKRALVLFPIRLDDTVMQCTTSWAAHLKRMRHITDFTGWKHHDDYQKALTRLLRDLKAETPPEGSTPYQQPLN